MGTEKQTDTDRWMECKWLYLFIEKEICKMKIHIHYEPLLRHTKPCLLYLSSYSLTGEGLSIEGSRHSSIKAELSFTQYTWHNKWFSPLSTSHSGTQTHHLLLLSLFFSHPVWCAGVLGWLERTKARSQGCPRCSTPLMGHAHQQKGVSPAEKLQFWLCAKEKMLKTCQGIWISRKSNGNSLQLHLSNPMLPFKVFDTDQS